MLWFLRREHALTRVDTIIRAAARLQRGRHFAGVVPGGQAFAQRLNQLATALRTPRFIYVRFHRGVIPCIYRFEAGFVLSDFVEAISFAAQEMMVMGKPLITPSFSGLSANITDRENGFVVETRLHTDWAMGGANR